MILRRGGFAFPFVLLVILLVRSARASSGRADCRDCDADLTRLRAKARVVCDMTLGSTRWPMDHPMAFVFLRDLCREAGSQHGLLLHAGTFDGSAAELQSSFSPSSSSSFFEGLQSREVRSAVAPAQELHDCTSCCSFDGGTLACAITEPDDVVWRTDSQSCSSIFKTQVAPSLGSVAIQNLVTGASSFVLRTPFTDLFGSGIASLVTSLSLAGSVASTVLASIAPAFPALQSLYLSGVELPVSGALGQLPNLLTLSIVGSSIFPTADLRRFSRLRDLTLGLTWATNSLSADAFSHLTHLESLSVGGALIKALPQGVFDTLTSLIILDLASNGMESLPPQVFDKLTLLDSLSLFNNSITALPSKIFDRLTALSTLFLGKNKLTSLQASTLSPLTNLFALAIPSNRIDTLDRNMFQRLSSLSYLDMSHNHLTEIPSLTRINDTLEYLDVSSNSISTVPSNLGMLRYLNVSFNTDFEASQDVLDMLQLVLLDVSATRWPQNILHCENWEGETMTLLQARALVGVRASTQSLNRFIASCVPQINFLDISENRVDSLDFLRSALTNIKYPLNVGASDTKNNTFISQLQLGEKDPLRCPLVRRDELRSYNNVSVTLPNLVFSCVCSEGYSENDGGICEKIPPYWTNTRVTALSFGMLTLSFFLFFIVQRGVKKHKSVKADLELQRYLLEETEGEVQALKRAWDVSPSEISLDVRVDLESPGAFGEVWRGTWDGITVAVKILQRDVIGLDDAAVEEFHKEVEFIQRARHPNLVRFFGAGTWHNSMPFFVIELVSKGSLRAFLRGRSSALGPPLLPPPEVPWSLKISLSLDVARGMAYIHSLGIIHRDLKSGNVLISDQNRAKITDFGTVRDILQRKRRGRPLAMSSGGGSGLGADVQLDGNLTAGKGTPLYMSPEVILGGDYNQSADVWSYGVLLWEIAEQRSPDILEQEGITRQGPMMSNLARCLEEGRRLKLSDEWPSFFTQVIRTCWIEPSDRLPFAHIVRIMEEGSTMTNK